MIIRGILHVVLLVASCLASSLATEKPRVIVSTDIGGGDPDDHQSMVHYLVYADRFDTEGLISSPPQGGRASDILDCLAAYEKDYPNLRRWSEDYNNHPDLWWIESDTTFRGMYMGGEQGGDLGNKAFPRKHVAGHGHLGSLFMHKKADIKMGDSPSVLYLLHGNPEEPEAPHWGGAFIRPDPKKRPTYWHDNPDPELSAHGKNGAKTVNRWRTDYLRDWQARMDRVQAARPAE